MDLNKVGPLILSGVRTKYTQNQALHPPGSPSAPGPALVWIIVIPIVILVTIWSAWVMGYTIDRVSLFALIFSIGILVDDATVVVENIFRRWLEEGRYRPNRHRGGRGAGGGQPHHHRHPDRALRPAAHGLRQRHDGPLHARRSRPWARWPCCSPCSRPSSSPPGGPISCARAWRRLKKAEEHGSAGCRRPSSRVYYPVDHGRFVRNRLAWPGSCLIAMRGGGVFWPPAPCSTPGRSTVKMLPFDNKPEFNVVVNLPEGTALPVTANAVNQPGGQAAARRCQRWPLCTGLYRRPPPRSTSTAWCATTICESSRGRRTSKWCCRTGASVSAPVMSWRRPPGSGSPRSPENLGAHIAVVEMPPGPPVLQTMVAEVYGPDDTTRRRVARDLMEGLRGGAPM